MNADVTGIEQQHGRHTACWCDTNERRAYCDQSRRAGGGDEKAAEQRRIAERTRGDARKVRTRINEMMVVRLGHVTRAEAEWRERLVAVQGRRRA